LSSIRPLDPDDIPDVADLFERVVRSGSRASPDLVSYFERTCLGHPWVDPEIPSLVYLDGEGKIVGFLGSHVRRLRLDGNEIRLACSGQLVVEPEARHGAAGALLTRRYLGGPQDLTITDGATGQIRRMWDRLGGETAGITSLAWTRVFRPWRFAARYLVGVLEKRRVPADRRDGLVHPGTGPRWAYLLVRALSPVLSLLDAITAAVAGRILRPRAPDAVTAEQLTPRAVIEQMRSLAQSLRLHPDYDEAFLTWLFDELASSTKRGRLVASLIRNRESGVLGWYVYYLKPGGISQVLQVALFDRDDAREVLDHLFHHASENRSTALRGRVEPRLVEPLSRRWCILRHSGEALVHSQRADVLAALASREAMLTMLEGEWWMEHHL
jgi:hypothetical protein